MSTALEFDVRQSEQFAREVEVMRRSTGDQIVILDILSTLVAAAAAFVALRAARDHGVLPPCGGSHLSSCHEVPPRGIQPAF